MTLSLDYKTQTPNCHLKDPAVPFLEPQDLLELGAKLDANTNRARKYLLLREDEGHYCVRKSKNHSCRSIVPSKRYTNP